MTSTEANTRDEPMIAFSSYTSPILFRQELVYLWSGSDLRRDSEGRGTLILTEDKIRFISDEDERRQYEWKYSQFSTYQLNTSRVDWAHQHMLCTFDDEDDGKNDEAMVSMPAQSSSPSLTPSDSDPILVRSRWMKQRPKKRAMKQFGEGTSDDDDYDKDEDDGCESASERTLDLITRSLNKLVARPVVKTEMEDYLVKELRFVLPKPDIQRKTWKGEIA